MEHCKVIIMNYPVLLIAMKPAYEYLISYVLEISANLTQAGRTGLMNGPFLNQGL